MTPKKNPHAVALGRKGGLANKGKTTEAKAAAARINGSKGGRPAKHRGHTIARTPDGNYTVRGLTEQAATVDTARRWIDQAISSGELRER